MRLALYQPDIPQNTGALIRLAACFNVPIEIIEPCGFPLSDRSLKRSAMDYAEQANVIFRQSWDAFRDEARSNNRRLVLLTTQGDHLFHQISYTPGDILLTGRESAGVPDDVHRAADLRVKIPMAPKRRSLNVAMAGAIVLAEALRQTSGWPPDTE